MDDDTGRVPCPSCGCPGQPVEMRCGFCGQHVPTPAAATDALGSLKRTTETIIGYRGFKVMDAAVTADPDGDYSYNGAYWRQGAVPVLGSPVYGMLWHPGADDGSGWYVAICHGSGRRDHVAHGPHDDVRANPYYHGPDAIKDDGSPDEARWSPVKECGGGGHGCGFYTSRTWAHALENGYHGYSEEAPHILARIQLAGKVIPATNGWRAQKVRLVELFVPHEMWKMGAALKDAYGPHGVTITVAATMVMPGSKADGAIEWCARCSAKMPKRSRTCDFCHHTHT